MDLLQCFLSGFASELPVKVFKESRCLQLSLGVHEVDRARDTQAELLTLGVWFGGFHCSFSLAS